MDTQPRGRITTYICAHSGAFIDITKPDGSLLTDEEREALLARLAEQTREASGQRIREAKARESQIDTSQPFITYTYDPIGKLMAITHPDGTVEVRDSFNGEPETEQTEEKEEL